MASARTKRNCRMILTTSTSTFTKTSKSALLLLFFAQRARLWVTRVFCSSGTARWRSSTSAATSATTCSATSTSSHPPPPTHPCLQLKILPFFTIVFCPLPPSQPRSPCLRYADEEGASKCVQALHGRFFASILLTPEFSPVTDFREARCRQVRAFYLQRTERTLSIFSGLLFLYQQRARMFFFGTAFAL